MFDLLAILFFTFIGYSIGLRKKTQKSTPKAPAHNGFANKKNKPEIEEPIEIQFLNASMNNRYESRNLLNKSEIDAYWTLVKLLRNQFYVNPQVSLGEILSCENTMGYRAINSKRADFVLTDKNFKPVAVIELQGSGHYQGEHEIRDSIKFNALSNAGIKYIQIFGSNPTSILETLTQSGILLNQSNHAQPRHTHQ